jgi:hypothetical protein
MVSRYGGKNTAAQIPKEITNCWKNASCTTEQTSALFEMVCPTLKKLGDCLKPAISCIKQSMADQSLCVIVSGITRTKSYYLANLYIPSNSSPFYSMTGLFNDCDAFFSGRAVGTATEASDEGIARKRSSDKTTAPKQTSDEGNATATATEPSDKTTAAIKPEQTSIGRYIDVDFPAKTEDVDSATSVQGSLFFLLAIALL